MPPTAVQSTLDDLGTPLRDVTFVVVDLETTGGSPTDAGITEIGAVKIRGGEVLGEFQTLVNPGSSVAPFVALLTGITDAMLVDAPPLRAVLPAFLEFAHGCVLVAHNAPYDVSFLRGACSLHDITWPTFPVVDTARLARSTLPRDEVPNCKLGTLAAHFHATTSPTHRALDDARATVDVLHALLERLGRLGVQSLEELTSVNRRVTTVQRRKRGLADHLPDSAGVNLFRDASGRVLYIGKSRHVRTRVRTYFTASEQRRRMAEMVNLTARVDAIPCCDDLEASVRELRLIAEHRPPYNRRSKFPERIVWLKLTTDAFPRLSTVRGQRDDLDSGAAYIGPFSSRAGAALASEALLQAVPLRTCTTRLTLRGTSNASTCVLADMGRCGAPCVGRQSSDDYAHLAHDARVAMTSDPSAVVDAVNARLAMLIADERFEDAAVWRDRLAAFLRGAQRFQRLHSLRSIDELVAASPASDGGWLLHVIRNGRLVASGSAARGVNPYPVVDALLSAADTGTTANDGSSVEEAELILRWLETPGTRLVQASQPWSSPVSGAARFSVASPATTGVLHLSGDSAPAGGWRTEARPLVTRTDSR